MSLKTTFMKQTCVYWPPAGEETAGQSYNDEGQPLFGSPIELSCRWTDKTEKIADANGEEIFSRSKVMVDSVSVGGILMLGTFDDVTDEEDPLRNDGAYQVRRYDSTPSVDASETYHWAYL